MALFGHFNNKFDELEQMYLLGKDITIGSNTFNLRLVKKVPNPTISINYAWIVTLNGGVEICVPMGNQFITRHNSRLEIIREQLAEKNFEIDGSLAKEIDNIIQRIYNNYNK